MKKCPNCGIFMNAPICPRCLYGATLNNQYNEEVTHNTFLSYLDEHKKEVKRNFIFFVFSAIVFVVLHVVLETPNNCSGFEGFCIPDNFLLSMLLSPVYILFLILTPVLFFLLLFSLSYERNFEKWKQKYVIFRR